MFIIKKIVSQLVYPLPFIMFIAIIVAMVLVLKQKKQSIDKLVILLIFAFTLISFQPVPRLLSRSLEQQYLKLDSVPAQISAIVVLGGGSCSDPTVPTSSQLSPQSLIRLTEGISLFNQTDSARLILTGGAVLDTVTIAETQRKMAIALGVDSLRISLADSALDTEMEARAVKKMVPSGKIVLVTSATHMPRAMGLFRKAGMNPIPAPTNYLAVTAPLTPGDFFPSGRNIETATVAWHEYLGVIWSKLRNRI